jgi:hypothetical protein
LFFRQTGPLGTTISKTWGHERLWLEADLFTLPERRPPACAEPVFEVALRFQRIEFQI